jgi:hypothetical protein
MYDIASAAADWSAGEGIYSYRGGDSMGSMLRGLPEFAVGDKVVTTGAWVDMDEVKRGAGYTGEITHVYVTANRFDVYFDRDDIPEQMLFDYELAPAAVPPPVDAPAPADDELTRLRARVAALEAENIDLKQRIAEMKARAWRVSVGISTIEVDLGKLIRELREPQA